MIREVKSSKSAVYSNFPNTNNHFASGGSKRGSNSPMQLNTRVISVTSSTAITSEASEMDR